MSNNKKIYRAFVDTLESPISVFLKPWYLDAATNGKWDVALVTEKEQIRAALPFVKNKHKKFFQGVYNIPFCPAVAPHIEINDKLNTNKKIIQKRSLLTKVFKALPSYDYLKLKVGNHLIDWRPLYWLGNFSQSSAYSSRLPLSVLEDDYLSRYKSSLRNTIKKAEKMVAIEPSTDSRILYKLIESTFTRKGQQVAVSYDAFDKIISGAKENNCLHAYIGRVTDSNKIAGCIVCIEDYNCLYYIFGGLEEDLKSYNSQPLLVHHAIGKAKELNKDFDFEGSMIKGIDHFFMSFSPEVIPYSVISSTTSKILKFLDFRRTLH